MHTTLALSRLYESGRLHGALKTVSLEARTLVGALLSPNRIISEVKAMRALQAEADRVEATQPARAAALRQRAARMPL